jgi:hypothetical protein
LSQTTFKLVVTRDELRTGDNIVKDECKIVQQKLILEITTTMENCLPQAHSCGIFISVERPE